MNGGLLSLDMGVKLNGVYGDRRFTVAAPSGDDATRCR